MGGSRSFAVGENQWSGAETKSVLPSASRNSAKEW